MCENFVFKNPKGFVSVKFPLKENAFVLMIKVSETHI